MSKLREIAIANRDETDYLAKAARSSREFLSARRMELIAARDTDAPETATAVLDPAAAGVEPWVQAMAPLRFSRGDAQLLALGSRTGGRRYLSEDIEVLERLAAIVCDQVERIRNSEMQAAGLASRVARPASADQSAFPFQCAEHALRYDRRENASARQLVLNLAGLFRYSFAENRGLIRIEEELNIVRAYLEIEELRLGPQTAHRDRCGWWSPAG